MLVAYESSVAEEPIVRHCFIGQLLTEGIALSVKVKMFRHFDAAD